MSLAECEAKYGHLTEIGQEDNYLPSGPEEEAEIDACFDTFEAERIRQEEEAERLAAEEAAAAAEAERIRLEEARLAAIEAERLAAERIRLDAFLAAVGLSFEEY